MAKTLTADEVEAFVRQMKLMGVCFVGLFLTLVGYTLYLNKRLPLQPLKPSAPTDLEPYETAPSGLYHLAAQPVVGQVVYVPAYSHVYHGAGDPYQLAITLSVRNTSMDSEIIVDSVRYFDTKGQLVKAYLDKPVRLPALGTTEVVVERNDTSGGSGANFLVEWHSKTPVTEPIIEAVMISTGSPQAISFARRGSVISVATQERVPEDAADTVPTRREGED